jgi:hypothetical protein
MVPPDASRVCPVPVFAEFCTTNDLVIGGIILPHKTIHTTWFHSCQVSSSCSGAFLDSFVPSRIWFGCSRSLPWLWSWLSEELSACWRSRGFHQFVSFALQERTLPWPSYDVVSWLQFLLYVVFKELEC